MTHPTDDSAFRLPEGTRPLRYDAELRVDPAGRAFTGELRLALSLTSPTSEIVLHATDLTIPRAVVRAGGREVPVSSVTPKPASETVVIALGQPAGPGEVTVELTWSGRFCEGLRGLYPAGAGVAATQFEAADARRVFPCLDEPGFKAPWRLAVELPAGTPLLGNAEVEAEEARGATRRVIFRETPPLPTYLVALALGPLVSGPEERVRGVAVRTWSVAEKVALTAFGQEAALAALPRLEDYFGLPYAFGKLDQVALPEFEAGAMENAGLITFREVALLLDPATAALAQKKRVAEVVTHELAHQWFGNLVTMKWWDDLWLNEAIATWMAYLIVDDWRPEWRMWLDFDKGKAAALALDALASTHPIRSEVRTVAEATESFDLITYEKGGAVLRMIEGWLGAGPFRDGIRLYMRRHARGNAVADDLWGALGEASSLPVVELANAWIRQPGHPLVRVSREGRTLRLSQRRFLSDPGAAAPAEGARWPIPLVIRWADADGVHETRTLLRLESRELELPGAGPVAWVTANAGSTGFYRVAYDAASLAALAANLEALAPAERIGLLSDEWALVRAGEREIGPVADLLVAFAGEQDHAVLDEVVGRLSILEHRLVADADRQRLRERVAGLFGPPLDRVGWEPAPGEEDAVRLRRAALVRAAGLVGRAPAVVAEATARLDRFLAGERGALEANLHDAAVVMAARGGDAARYERFAALAERETEPTFKRRYLYALAAFEEPSLSARAIELAFSDRLPLQEAAGFAGALLGNPAARGPFWEQLRARWAAFHGRLAHAPMLVRRTVEAMAALVTRAQLEEVEAFLAAHPMEEARQAVAQTVERLRQDVALRERSLPAVGRWLGGRGA
ncbi:MAG TPA: M1 family aminopeptidase [Anaeromyxobacteraceae bacterium]|nr:M1 family aminopeptidase [Anaeromyxobacteraceae bacterium]